MSDEHDVITKEQPPFNSTIIKKGVFYFMVISIISMVSVFLYTNTGNTIEVWKGIEFKYIFFALFLMFFELLIGGYRNHIFVRELYPGKSHWVSIKANLANIFMGAVTPSQSGGGLAQMYIFHKNGIKFGDALTISFINWITTLTFLPISGYIAYQIIKDKISGVFINYLAQFGLTVFGILFVVLFIAIVFPSFISWIIQKLSKVVGKVNNKWQSKIETAGSKAKDSLVEYRNKCGHLLHHKPILFVFTFLLTTILYFSKYLMGYVVVLALGVEIDFATVAAVQSLVFLLLYFAPSPGASGIAEFTIAGLMTGILSNDYIPTFTLMSRSFLIFLPAIIGSVIVLRELKKYSEQQ